MNRSKIVVAISVCMIVSALLKCGAIPQNPSVDPMNSSLSLYFSDNNNTVEAGVPKQVGLVVTYPVHIKSVTLTSSCGDFNAVPAIDAEKYVDTLFFNPVFLNEGLCTLFVYGEMINNQITARADTISILVIPGAPTLSFSGAPQAFSTHTGKADTLCFAVNSRQINDVTYTLAGSPVINSGEIYLLESSDKDTASVYFNPQLPDVYTVSLTATGNTLSATASVSINVFASLSPSESDNPQTILTGVVDTLVYALTPEQIAVGVTIELINEVQLPADIATVIPSSPDSIIIAVNSNREGSLSFSIATANSEYADTSGYSILILNKNSAVWVTESAAIDAVEGVLKVVDLTPYLFEGVSIDAVSPTDEVGTVNEDATWSYTPVWGSEAAVTVKISGIKGEVPQDFTLMLNVAPGDETAPRITLQSPETESKKVSSSQVTVSVVVEDAGAGVEKVSFATSEKTVEGTLESGNTWSAVITGLSEGTATEIVITAIDKSMKKNSGSKTISLTYDQTVEDSDGPIITRIDGVQSGDRVTAATGNIVYSVSDDSGIDSIWWTLNNSFVEAFAVSGENVYTIDFVFSVFGQNVITLHAKDRSDSANMSSKAVTLYYNTVPAPVTIVSPAANATNVSTSPIFKWNGGDDADGDDMTFTVRYGASGSSLSSSAAVSNKTTATAGSVLDFNKTYYWQVVAWSNAFPDTVKSKIVSFTTLDATAEDHDGPQIAQTTGPESGGRVTESTGTISVSVNDQSDVSSVTVKLNDSVEQALTAGTTDVYSYNYVLLSGENTITFTAVDGSVNSNSSQEIVTLNYNAELSEVLLITPTLNATDVSTSPTFSWSGGDDLDDNVTFSVKYGTEQGSLSSTAAVSGKTATVSSSLAYSKTYYWQVNAKSSSTDYPDEVTSSVGTFTTEGTLPVVTTDPEGQLVKEGHSASFSVSADGAGFGTLSYQWLESGGEISGATGDTYTISSATMAMDGNVYSCKVTNGVGDVTSESATLKVAPSSVEDGDGNSYTTVIIGNQIWMAENLRTTKYRDGSDISNVTSDDAWAGLSTGACCWYENNESYKRQYGAMYNWYAVNTGKLAPAGWHVASYEEYVEIETYYGYVFDGSLTGDAIAKSLASTTGWMVDTTEGSVGNNQSLNNSTGFSGFPGGYRMGTDGEFTNIGENCIWWASSEYEAGKPWSLNLWYRVEYLSRNYDNDLKNGFYVRCLKD